MGTTTVTQISAPAPRIYELDPHLSLTSSRMYLASPPGRGNNPAAEAPAAGPKTLETSAILARTRSESDPEMLD